MHDKKERVKATIVDRDGEGEPTGLYWEVEGDCWGTYKDGGLEIVSVREMPRDALLASSAVEEMRDLVEGRLWLAYEKLHWRDWQTKVLEGHASLIAMREAALALTLAIEKVIAWEMDDEEIWKAGRAARALVPLGRRSILDATEEANHG